MKLEIDKWDGNIIVINIYITKYFCPKNFSPDTMCFPQFLYLGFEISGKDILLPCFKFSGNNNLYIYVFSKYVFFFSTNFCLGNGK